MAAITARQFLKDNGFIVGDRGRFNAEQLQFLKDKGFDVTVPVAKVDKPIVESEGSKIRAWAKENGIAVSERGKLSTALKSAYAANDVSLAVKMVEIKIKANRTGRVAKPEVIKQVAAKAVNKPIVRDVDVAFAIDAKGVVIAFNNCGKCHESVSRCTDDMPSVPKFLSKTGETFTVQLNRPEKLRHESLTLPKI